MIIGDGGVFGGVEWYGDGISGMSWIERGYRTMRGSVIPGIGVVVSESIFGFSGWGI